MFPFRVATPTLAEYAERDRLLLELGYRSYPEYLASQRWASIRARVFELRGRRCLRCCRRFASQVHHREYTAENLAGTSLRGLFPVCRLCHEQAERPDGRAAGLAHANEALGLTAPGTDRARPADPGHSCQGCRRTCYGAEVWCPGCRERAARREQRVRRRRHRSKR